jgi:hypothetical protein
MTFYHYPAPSSRCVIVDGEIRRELHCGDCFTLVTSEDIKVHVRIEMGSREWVLIGATPSHASAWDGARVTP